MKNDGGPVGMWLLSGNQGACTQLLCLPYGISRPALHSLPFFSSMLSLARVQSGDEDVSFY